MGDFPAWLSPSPPPPAQGRIVVNVGIVRIPQPPKLSDYDRERKRRTYYANRDKINERTRLARAALARKEPT